MNHLSDEQIYDLALKVVNQSSFSSEDVANMKHVGQCDMCYNMLCSIMAIHDIASHLVDFATAPIQEVVTATIKGVCSAIIQLTIGAARPILSQIDSGLGSWTFGSPLAVAGSRALSVSESTATKLEDVDNSKTFIAYDSEKQLLVVQVDCSDISDHATVQLRSPDGTTNDIPLTKRGSVLWAEVSDLPDGKYDIILKK